MAKLFFEEWVATCNAELIPVIPEREWAREMLCGSLCVLSILDNYPLINHIIVCMSKVYFSMSSKGTMGSSGDFSRPFPGAVSRLEPSSCFTF